MPVRGISFYYSACYDKGLYCKHDGYSHCHAFIKSVLQGKGDFEATVYKYKEKHNYRCAAEHAHFLAYCRENKVGMNLGDKCGFAKPYAASEKSACRNGKQRLANLISFFCNICPRVEPSCGNAHLNMVHGE